jgi:hypothetical protein
LVIFIGLLEVEKNNRLDGICFFVVVFSANVFSTTDNRYNKPLLHLLHLNVDY